MSLKQNLEHVKNEFKSDEKIFESAFKIERFFKKYKILLFVLLGVCVVLFAYFQISGIIEENRAKKATEFYNKLLDEPNNQALREGLAKNSEELFLFFELSQAMKSGDEVSLKKLEDSKNVLVAELAKYQNASLQKDLQALANVQIFSLQELAKLQQAFLLIQNNQVKEAHELLQSIQEDSLLKDVIKILLHYKNEDKK
ncbi:hypothetical protein [Helicobacter anatolicus]|uniref:hypothetical protein n=1 Tax=Helicobacter anatolicus TaxID=2905874 RepID=UPI001E379C61|nr:hypothetical protein [Helicobacter anatolicus]MCE3040325.1 hypothetical protein [Helicobacter anatolicus]